MSASEAPGPSEQSTEREAAALVRQCRDDSLSFTSSVFGHIPEPYQAQWHDAWNEPEAHIVQWSPVEHGKTVHAIGWALYTLGRSTLTGDDERILWVGESKTAAEKAVGVIKRAIEEPSSLMRLTFPKLAPGSVWRNSQLLIQGSKPTEKDYSIEAVGIGGTILGGRFTRVILDDTCTFSTTYTAALRKTMRQWVLSTVISRLLPGGRMIVLGNAWYPDDLMHDLAERNFRTIKNRAYALDQGGVIIAGSVLWPARWPQDRLTRRRRELGTVESQRQLQCDPYRSSEGRFNIEWFEQAMEAGKDLTLLHEYTGPWWRFGGLDLGVQQKDGADNTAGTVLAVDPDTKKRRPVDMFEQQFDGPATVAKLGDWNRRYDAIVKVENNAAQDFIRQFAGAAGIPTRPHTTGKNKADPSFGVPSLGVELEQGMWILPIGDERSREMSVRFRTQCLDWEPGRHTGDLLMSVWFAREAAREGIPTAAATSSGARLRAAYDPKRLDAGVMLGRRTSRGPTDQGERIE